MLKCLKQQKAYLSKKKLQEAVIDVLGNIKNCIVNDSLAEFLKAFNTISHNYILKSLKFFNFCDYMIYVVETLLTGRCASVLTDKLKISPLIPESHKVPRDQHSFSVSPLPLPIKLKMCLTIETFPFEQRDT